MTENERYVHENDKLNVFLFPDSVKNWFIDLYNHMVNANISEMSRLYNQVFHTLTSTYFKTSPWPEPSSIENFVDKDQCFLLLYTQIYFGHISSKLLSSNLEIKIQSWLNYCAIFDGILNGTLEFDLLPSKWIFDIVAEFVYQYQSFTQYKIYVLSTKNIDNELIECKKYLDSNSNEPWNTKTVFTYLRSLIKYSSINEQLANQNQSNKITDAFLSELGYFSIICLSRAHVLIGDYNTSIQILKPLMSHILVSNNNNKKIFFNLYHQVPFCLFSALYHIGIAHLLLEEFDQAEKYFYEFLILLPKNKNRLNNLYPSDAEIMDKLYEKTLAQLAITLYLTGNYNQRNLQLSQDENIYRQAISKLNENNNNAVDLFVYACPKFILPFNNFSQFENILKNSQMKGNIALEAQKQRFIELVQKNSKKNLLKKYLKLFKSISIKDLADLCSLNEKEVRSELMAMNLTSYKNNEKINFDLNMDLVTIDTNTTNNNEFYGQYFYDNIKKFHHIIKEVS